MRTPPLRRRIAVGGMVVVALLLLALGAFVYLAVRERLERDLAELLDVRADVATNLALDLEGEALADRLAALGVPAAVTTAEGRRLLADPAVPGVGAAGPPTSVAEPRASYTAPLPDGGAVKVFATRAGVQATLRNLLAALLIGTLAGVVLAYVLLQRVTARALAPLDDVVATAERITAGASGERLGPDREDSELGRMAVAFDRMLDALEAALGRAAAEQERTRRFLADAAHQLRTPLTGIRASAELLLQENDPEVRDRLIGTTVRETARASRLIAELLHIARLDRAEEPQRVATDLVALCRGELERTAAIAPQLELGLEGPDASGEPVRVDADEVRDAVSNLLDNARRHARGRVWVRIEEQPAWVEIRVEDDGDGLPEDAEELVFDRFVTLDGKGGTGLGLPIARAVARAHGGDLTYEDGGFVLQLPRRSG